jgi:hypothetical protein
MKILFVKKGSENQQAKWEQGGRNPTGLTKNIN